MTHKTLLSAYATAISYAKSTFPVIIPEEAAV